VWRLTVEKAIGQLPAGHLTFFWTAMIHLMDGNKEVWSINHLQSSIQNDSRRRVLWASM
jgi:hypothetical protein